MTGPYRENSIVIDAETNEPTEYIQFEPNGFPGDFWLHPRDKFDPGDEFEDVVDEHALPESDSYRIRLVEIPAGETIRIGPVAAMNGRDGGGDLVDPIEHGSIPDEWVRETMTFGNA